MLPCPVKKFSRFFNDMKLTGLTSKHNTNFNFEVQSDVSLRINVVAYSSCCDRKIIYSTWFSGPLFMRKVKFSHLNHADAELMQYQLFILSSKFQYVSVFRLYFYHSLLYLRCLFCKVSVCEWTIHMNLFLEHNATIQTELACMI